ncbi:MAG: sulfotransferase [Pseudomonadota bacterium]
MKPNFIGIGVQKCATSWLHETLSAHADIFTSDPKEIDFFTCFYDRGYEWYERHFADGAGAAARGETSPSYFYDRDAPARVHAYNPEARIIVIFRDPVERAYSNHLHEVRKRHFSSDLRFEAGMANNPCYVEQGRYATHFRRWLELFPREQILALLFEDIRRDPDTALKQVYTFLGVDPEARVDIAGRRSNESVAFRFEALALALQRGGKALRKAGLGGALERFKAFGPVRALMNLNKQDLREAVPPMSEESRRAIAAELADEMRELAVLLGRESLPWKSAPAGASPAAEAPSEPAAATA